MATNAKDFINGITWTCGKQAKENGYSCGPAYRGVFQAIKDYIGDKYEDAYNLYKEVTVDIKTFGEKILKSGASALKETTPTQNIEKTTPTQTINPVLTKIAKAGKSNS